MLREMTKEDEIRGVPCVCPTCTYRFATVKQINGRLFLFAGLQKFVSIDSYCPMCGGRLTYSKPTKSFKQLWERWQKRLAVEKRRKVN